MIRVMSGCTRTCTQPVSPFDTGPVRNERTATPSARRVAAIPFVRPQFGKRFLARGYCTAGRPIQPRTGCRPVLCIYISYSVSSSHIVFTFSRLRISHTVQYSHCRHFSGIPSSATSSAFAFCSFSLAAYIRHFIFVHPSQSGYHRRFPDGYSCPVENFRQGRPQCRQSANFVASLGLMFTLCPFPYLRPSFPQR